MLEKYLTQLNVGIRYYTIKDTEELIYLKHNKATKFKAKWHPFKYNIDSFHPTWWIRGYTYLQAFPVMLLTQTPFDQRTAQPIMLNFLQLTSLLASRLYMHTYSIVVNHKSHSPFLPFLGPSVIPFPWTHPYIPISVLPIYALNPTVVCVPQLQLCVILVLFIFTF